jgi:hypothetical protein
MIGKRQRNLFLPIPLKIILNERGVSFFTAHHRGLHCFESADGDRHFGFRLERTDFSWLKRLIIKNYLLKIEIQIRDISVCRRHLEDAVKLVFFSMFRHRINLSVLGYIYNSPMLRAWNRANPKKAIKPGMEISKTSLEALLDSKVKGRLGELKNELYRKIIKSLPASLVELREYSRDLHNFIGELISGINPLVLLVLAGSKGDDKATLVQNISAGVIESMYRLDIVNLASMLTMELVSAAERSALVRLLENTGNIMGVLENPDKRKSIMEEKRFRGSTVVAAFPREIPSENRRLRFRISVYNDGADAETERRLMDDFAEKSFSFMEGRQYEEFLKIPRIRRPGLYEDSGLCFYHLNTLREQCRKNKILLDATIKDSRSGDSAVTTLWFGF